MRKEDRKERKDGWKQKKASKQEKKPEKEAGEIADLDSNVIENYEKVTQILIIS